MICKVLESCSMNKSATMWNNRSSIAALSMPTGEFALSLWHWFGLTSSTRARLSGSTLLMGVQSLLWWARRCSYQRWWGSGLAKTHVIFLRITWQEGRHKSRSKNVLSPPLSLDTGVGEGSVLWPNFFFCGMADVSVMARQVKHDLMETDKVDVRVNQIEYADDWASTMVLTLRMSCKLPLTRLQPAITLSTLPMGWSWMRASANSWSSGPERRPTLTCAGQNKIEMIKLLGLYRQPIDLQILHWCSCVKSSWQSGSSWETLGQCKS